MAEIENGRCHAERAPLDSPSLIQHGKLVIQAHHIGWMVCSVLTLVAMGVTFWLVERHLRWYTNKHEQRYIVRILFMVPLYAIISTASYFWWNHSTPLLLLRDCYESTVLTAFFYLLLLYLSPNPNAQKEIFRKNGLSRQDDKERRRRGEPIQKWVMPLGFVRWKPEDGLYFLQLMKWGVLQYCVVRPGTTLAAVILDYVGLYCEDSWSPGWGHIYIVVVVSISVSIAMYCLIQLYMTVKVELAPQKPLLKLLAIKAVVFLTFWQATFLSVLTLFGIVKDTPYMTADNINIGIGAIAETFEMALIACLHIKAFSYKPYCTGGESTLRWRSFIHAMNFKETGREIWGGLVYLLHKSRGHEVDTQARREAALENVFGHSRNAITREAKSGSGKNTSEKDLGVRVDIEREVRVGDERQWLGVGDDYIYGLGYQEKRHRERSEGLESQIEKELVRRGYTMRGIPGGTYTPIVDAEAVQPSNHQRTQASWWRRIYNRLSQSGPDPAIEGTFPPTNNHLLSHRPSRRRSRDVSNKVSAAPPMADVHEDYDDPPPPSAIRTYRESKRQSNGNKEKERNLKRKPPPPLDPPLLFTSFGDIPSPLSSPDSPVDGRISVPQPQLLQLCDIALTGPRVALLTPPLLSPSARSSKSDSFLERAFAASVEQGSSAEMPSAGPPSSQSHHSHVRLGSSPVVDTQVKAQPKTPMVVDFATASPPSTDPTSLSLPPAPVPARIPELPPVPAPAPSLAVANPSGPTPSHAKASTPPHVTMVREFVRSPTTVPPAAPKLPAQMVKPSLPALWAVDEDRGRRRSSHRRDSARFYPEPRNFSPPQYSSPSAQLPPVQRSSPSRPLSSPSPQSPHLQRATAAYSRGFRRNSGTPPYPTSYNPMNRYTPTRAQIVLPAPLAPTTSTSARHARGPMQQKFSSAQYMPPGPPISPPLRDRRWAVPHSSPNSNLPR